MNINRNSRIARHSLAALSITLIVAGSNLAGAAAVNSVAVDTPIPVTSGVLEQTTSLAGSRNSEFETSMKWRSNSFNIAGSRVWSKLIVFTSTSINVRLPIN